MPETGPVPRQSFLRRLGIPSLKIGERRRLGEGWVILTAQDQLSRWVRPTLALEPRADSLRAAVRRLPSGSLYVITNESDAWVTVSAHLPGPSGAKSCDLESGQITRAPHTLTLAPWGAICLLTDGRAAGSPPPVPSRSLPFPIQGDWQICRMDQVVIEADDYVRHTFTNDPSRPAQLGDWKDLVGAEISGTAEYRISLNFPFGRSNVSNH